MNSRRQEKSAVGTEPTPAGPQGGKALGQPGGSLRLQQSAVAVCSSELDVRLLLLCHFPIKLLQSEEKASIYKHHYRKSLKSSHFIIVAISASMH